MYNIQPPLASHCPGEVHPNHDDPTHHCLQDCRLKDLTSTPRPTTHRYSPAILLPWLQKPEVQWNFQVSTGGKTPSHRKAVI